MGKICSNCGENNKESAVSCVNCGKSLINIDSEVMKHQASNYQPSKSQSSNGDKDRNLSEIKNLLSEQNGLLRTIKNIQVFFFVLALVSIILWVIFFVSAAKETNELYEKTPIHSYY